jgi:undecaprenyl pyrophosphate synthase
MQVLLQKIILEHNHTLARSPSMTKQMSGHKMKEAAVDDMVNIMHKARVSHIKVIHVLHESVGGPQNLSIMEYDVQNRYNHCLKSFVQFLCAKMSDVLIE